MHGDPETYDIEVPAKPVSRSEMVLNRKVYKSAESFKDEERRDTSIPNEHRLSSATAFASQHLEQNTPSMEDVLKTYSTGASFDAAPKSSPDPSLDSTIARKRRQVVSTDM